MFHLESSNPSPTAPQWKPNTCLPSYQCFSNHMLWTKTQCVFRHETICYDTKNPIFRKKTTVSCNDNPIFPPKKLITVYFKQHEKNVTLQVIFHPPKNLFLHIKCTFQQVNCWMLLWSPCQFGQRAFIVQPHRLSHSLCTWALSPKKYSKCLLSSEFTQCKMCFKDNTQIGWKMQRWLSSQKVKNNTGNAFYTLYGCMSTDFIDRRANTCREANEGCVLAFNVAAKSHNVHPRLIEGFNEFFPTKAMLSWMNRFRLICDTVKMQYFAILESG